MSDTIISGVTEPGILRRGFTLYPRGVMAVAARVDGDLVGLAVSAFVSVSLEPPLILICIDRESRTWPRLARAGSIGVSVIAEDQTWLAKQLASRSADRFAGAEFTERATGALLLEGSVTQLECTIDSVLEGGDHLMVLLRVVGMSGDTEKAPLVWHDSTFVGLRPLA